MALTRDKTKIIETAERYIKGGKLREALKEYQRLLEKDPLDINIINIIGELFVRLNEKDKAQQEFQKIAKHYEEKGLYPQAIAIYKKIIKLNPGDVSLAVKLADLYGKYGFHTEAKNEYLRVAKELEKAGKIKEVIPLYEKLVKLEKNDLVVRMNLAELYQKEGMADEAVEELNAIAEATLEAGKLKEAEEVLIKAHSIKESQVRTVTNLFNLFKREERKKEAFALLTSALNKDAENVKLLHLLGTLYFEDKNFTKAKEVLTKIRSLKDMEPEARVKLGRIYIQEGNLDEAFELYEPVVDALVSRQRAEKAIGLLGLILSSKQVHLPSLEKLVSIYESIGDTEKLETVYRVILEEYREKDLKEKSFSVLEKLVRLCPKDKELLGEYRQLQKELGHEIEEELIPEPSGLPDEDREIIKMKLAKAEMYLEQGAIRDARRIIEDLKAEYADESKIDQKIALLDEIRTRVEEGKVSKGVPRGEGEKLGVVEEVQVEKMDEEKVSVADIFAGTDIITDVPRKKKAVEYYDLQPMIEGEIEIINTIIHHQLKGDTETFEQDLSDIISKFKKEMEEKIDREDYEIHYNLGIAFFEQGLIEEALDEFKIACQDEERALECYSVISYCYRQKKEFGEGIKWIEKGLQFSEKGTDQYLSLSYDLASLYKEMGQKEDALNLYMEIQELNPDYRAVGERIKNLKKRKR